MLSSWGSRERLGEMVGSEARWQSIRGSRGERARGRERETSGREREVVHVEVHESEREKDERATCAQATWRGVCPLYRGRRRFWKEWGSRVTSCHSALPSTSALIDVFSLNELILIVKAIAQTVVTMLFSDPNLTNGFGGMCPLPCYYARYEPECIHYTLYSVHFYSIPYTVIVHTILHKIILRTKTTMKMLISRATTNS